jgi:acyl-CoA thioesterase FadM
VRQWIEQRGKLCAEARCVLVHFDHQTQRPTPLPEELRTSLNRFHDASETEAPRHPG